MHNIMKDSLSFIKTVYFCASVTEYLTDDSQFISCLLSTFNLIYEFFCVANSFILLWVSSLEDII